MTATFDLPTASRLLLQAELQPLQGRRFQPTGFPDVGAGSYMLPDGEEHLLVESPQSVANRLESVCWDEATQDLIAPLTGLPYVRVTDSSGTFLTASVLEAHRINSPYVEKSSFFEVLKGDIGFDEKKPFLREKLVHALAKYDIGCLLHGVFLESIAGVLRVPRALSGFIEAEQVERVNVGGVKNDRVRASKDEDAGHTAKDGFGNVPFHRTEFVAGRITAYFNLDVEQIRTYRLEQPVQRLLYALAVFKVLRFLDSGLRLRTACDLSVGQLAVTKPSGFTLPSLKEVTEALPMLISEAKPSFAAPAVSVAQFAMAAPVKALKAKGAKS